MAVQISRRNYSPLQAIAKPIRIAKIGKIPFNQNRTTGSQALLGVPTPILRDTLRGAQTPNSAEFRPLRKWVAKISDYWARNRTVQHSNYASVGPAGA